MRYAKASKGQPPPPLRGRPTTQQVSGLGSDQFRAAWQAICGRLCALSPLRERGGLDLEAARRQELLKSEELIARFRKVLETERRNIREVPRSLHASLPSSLPARPGTHEAFDTHPRTQLLSWGVIVCATIRFSSSLVVRPASDSFSVTVKLHPRVASRRTSQDV